MESVLKTFLIAACVMTVMGGLVDSASKVGIAREKTKQMCLQNVEVFKLLKAQGE